MKNLLLAFALAFLATPAYSQFHLGLSGGVNRSYWNWSLISPGTGINYQPATCWQAAVLGEWQLTPAWGLRAEFGTQVNGNVRKGKSGLIFEEDILTGNPQGNPYDFRDFYQFWEGSVLVQVSPFKKFRALYFVAGGTAGRLTNAWNKLSYTENGIARKSENSIDLSDPNWNRNAFAADFGMGGNIPIGAHSKLKIEARYQHNLSNLSKSGNVDARVNTLMLNVGYLHRL
jgi:hypothetical protein